MTTAPTQVSPNQRIEELGRIIMAYSEVTERLQQSHEKLQDTVRALREELGEKNKLLERKNRLAALGEMAAGMAHEIRNPLGGINLYASLLAKDVEKAGMNSSLDVVRKISGGVKRLEAIVSSVLSFSREIHCTPASADLAQIAARAVEMAEPKLDQLFVTWEIEGPAEMPVNLDPLLIEQALLNLVLNAAEAMHERGGSIRIVYGPGEEVQARQCRITVKDTGPGIPPEVLDRIFNPFFTTKDTGMGVGLSISRSIAPSWQGS